MKEDVTEFFVRQKPAHFRGVVMLHDVRDGTFDPCIISSEYLTRK